jgi:hypothetical protein
MFNRPSANGRFALFHFRLPWMKGSHMPTKSLPGYVTAMIALFFGYLIGYVLWSHAAPKHSQTPTCERIGQIIDFGENCSPAPGETNGHYVCRQFGVWNYGTTIGAPRLEPVCEQQGSSAPDGGTSAR